MSRILLFAGWLFIAVLPVTAQHAFQNEIDSFRRADSIAFPGTDKIVFTGSSSFRLWKELQSDFPGHPIINRAFGGSTFDDLLYYRDRIIGPYKPRQVVIYCGENDLAGGASPGKVFENFVEFFRYIRSVSPEAHVLFVSIKPSPSRSQILDKVKEANALIHSFLSGEQRTGYVDIFTPMLDERGNFREELFVQDRLHMNRKGYAIWKAAIEPHLK